MALIDIRCSNNHLREVYRAAADWPKTPDCPECGASTEQTHLPKAVTWNPDPVIVFQAHDGTMRFPGDGNGLSARNYERQGFTRIEVRGAAEMRRLERHMNKAEYSRASRRVEQQCRAREEENSRRGAVIRHGMQQGFQIPERDDKGRLTGRLTTVRLSEQGRDVMRQAQATGDKRPAPRVHDAGFHNQAYSFDHSNREESRGSDGRRRRD